MIILCQPDHKGDLHVIAYASRALAEHEKNYTPFLLEMLACCWGIDHFEVYLKGRKFVIYSDHRPLEKLSCVHTKTLNRLQEKMADETWLGGRRSVRYPTGKLLIILGHDEMIIKQFLLTTMMDRSKLSD